MKDIRKQPENIIVGDYVILINEEEKFKEFKNACFLVGKIVTNLNNRNYQMTYYNGNPVNLEEGQYWTKKEYIEVVHRHEKDNVIYYKVNDWSEDEKEEDGLLGIVMGFLKALNGIFH